MKSIFRCQEMTVRCIIITIRIVTVDLFLYVRVSVTAIIYHHLCFAKLWGAFQGDSVQDTRGLKAPTSDNLGMRPGRIIRSVVTSLTQVQALCHSFFLPSHSQPWQGVRGNTFAFLRLGTGSQVEFLLMMMSFRSQLCSWPKEIIHCLNQNEENNVLRWWSHRFLLVQGQGMWESNAQKRMAHKMPFQFNKTPVQSLL